MENQLRRVIEQFFFRRKDEKASYGAENNGGRYNVGPRLSAIGTH